MDIRLIAFDLDGTLLDSQKRLSYRNEQALKECVRRGIEIVPCTGRIWQGVPDFLRNMPEIHYAITTNGAVVENVRTGEVIDEQKFSVETAVEILEMAKGFHTMYDVYAGGLAFGEARFIDHMEDYGLPQTTQRMIRQTRQIVPDMIARVRENGRPVEKINYFFGDMEERQRAKAALEKRGGLVVSSSFPYNLEINAPGATKGEAILRLAAYLGIGREQTMGFGDGENDLTMMELAGCGIAMENGMEHVKAAADHITISNDEDGVAAALEQYVFQNSEEGKTGEA